MDGININKYIETWYFRLEKNGEPVEVIPFNWAFSTNKYYDSDVPVAQLEGFNLLFNTNKKSTVDYRFDFKEKLSEKDRHAINERDTFHSLMRAYLPKFSLITENDEEIEVDEFVTVYEDGYCSITHVYNLNGHKFDKDLSNNLLNWGNMKYTKIDMVTYSMLRIENEAPLHFSNVDIPTQELLNVLNGVDGYRKFSIGLDIIITILSDFFRNEDNNLNDKVLFTVKKCIPIFRYYQFESNVVPDKNVVDELRSVLQNNPAEYVFNKNIDDVGLDLTQYEKSKTIGYGNMLIHINGVNFKHELEIIVSYFMLFDYFLIEKAKNYSALVKFREIEKNEDVENLMEIRSKIIKSLKTDLLYDFSEDNYIKAKAVMKCLHISIYIKELEQMYQRISDTIIKVKDKQNAEREKQNEEIEKQKEKQNEEIEKQIEKKREKMNFQIQIFALILAIPAIFSVIDIFYATDMPKLIVFPISYAKLLWMAVLVIMCKKVLIK